MHIYIQHSGADVRDEATTPGGGAHQSAVEDSDNQSMKVAKRDTKSLCKLCIYVHIYMGKQGNDFEAAYSTFYIAHCILHIAHWRTGCLEQEAKEASAPP